MDVIEKGKRIKMNINAASARAGRSADDVTVVAVTKYVTNERAQEAADAGFFHLGENRLEGLLEKKEVLTGQTVWHFIGSLQSRKVKDVINDIDYLHSLDRLSLAKEINKRADGEIKCFVQVNVSGEEQKHGISPENIIEFIDQLSKYDKIKVVGLMTMAPHTTDEKILRKCFKDLSKLKETIHTHGFLHAPCTELSMGMSNDYEIAIEEGATFVRIGSALVGE
ncbi:YggS family pyridoxal phosphate-dependent enzyme [Jeotgalibacillus proteolyticus]|uniref:Pyridoxal phosphate homeostasis protein n=1 Tax=Jeotgalibacillus proteolyticus TaxID=2082395 RepID=A0A2S5GGS2_9BACL|nr:YggS family pyridoxal phosphate-dependent enzyme [Jeotgalibacillus proteolyticus]PPA72124.1 YggS family pyridoxal phosphate-dependent enzyme [Jeotgalibacillus proteolyticus]